MSGEMMAAKHVISNVFMSLFVDINQRTLPGSRPGQGGVKDGPAAAQIFMRDIRSLSEMYCDAAKVFYSRKCLARPLILDI